MDNLKKQIIFDIDTKIAEQILGKSYNAIYDKIERFMKQNGFVHIEGSSYMSKNSMCNADVMFLLYGLKRKYPYLEKCIRDIRQTDISDVHSLNHLFSYDGTVGKFVQQDNKTDSLNPPEKNQEDFSLEQSKKINKITQPVKTSVTFEQAIKMAQVGIPFQIVHGDNKKVMAVFDKLDMEKVKQIKNLPSKKSRGR